MVQEEEQEQKVAQLLARLKAENAWDERKNDHYALRRFLRARNWDVAEAEKMWLAMVAWRKEWNVESMLDKQVLSEERQARLMQVFPHGLHGVDNKGRPILIYRMGEIDVPAVTAEFPELDLQRFHIQMYEFIMRVALPACSIAAGRHVDQVTNIFDLKGLGLWNMTKLRALFMPTMSITRDNYPETLGQVIVINSPAMFDSVYAVVKRMLSAETQSKIQVYGKAYQSALDKLIAKAQLPRCLGGMSDIPLGDNWGPWSQLIAKAVYRQSKDGGGSYRHGDMERKSSAANYAVAAAAVAASGILSPSATVMMGSDEPADKENHVPLLQPLASGERHASDLASPAALNHLNQLVVGDHHHERASRNSRAATHAAAAPSDVCFTIKEAAAAEEGRASSRPAMTATAVAEAPAPAESDTPFATMAAPLNSGEFAAALSVSGGSHAAAPADLPPERTSTPPRHANAALQASPFLPASELPFHAAGSGTHKGLASTPNGTGPGRGDMSTLTNFQTALELPTDVWSGVPSGTQQGPGSVGSFHTCLSLAESAALAAYLQRPSTGFSVGGSHRGDGGTSLVLLSPGAAGTHGIDPPPAINEEDVAALQLASASLASSARHSAAGATGGGDASSKGGSNAHGQGGRKAGSRHKGGWGWCWGCCGPQKVK